MWRWHIDTDVPPAVVTFLQHYDATAYHLLLAPLGTLTAASSLWQWGGHVVTPLLNTSTNSTPALALSHATSSAIFTPALGGALKSTGSGGSLRSFAYFLGGLCQARVVPV